MFGIAAHFIEERGGGGHDLVHQKFVGPVEPEQGRQFRAHLLADHRHRLGLVQRLVHHAQEIVEHDLVASLGNEAAQRAGRERREVDRLELR